MISFLFALVFMLLALVVVAMHQTYNFVPVKELRRLARGGDPLAKALYQAAAYGASLGLLLWIVVAIALVASFILLQQVAPPVFAFIVEAVVIGVGFAWIPTTDLTKMGARLVMWATPTIVWLLERLYPVFGKITKFAHEHRQITVHTGLYEQEDLLHLLEQQKAQQDSRISHEDLELLIHALTFGDKTVGECMTPRRMVRVVSADEHIGPVVIRELHESGHSRFPVYKDKEDNLVGTLYLRDLINLKKTGQVSDTMEQAVYYVHEEYPLEQALHAFLKTKHHLFIVVNRFEEFVGILTIEDIIEQILGCKIVDEFDAYDDLRAVASNHARNEHKAHRKDGEEPSAPKPEESEKDGENPTEVVE